MKKFAVTALMASFALIAFAQPAGRGDREQMREKLEAQRVAFMTRQLNLTTEEAQQFWPVYNEYQDREKAIKEEYKPTKKLEEMSDEEVEKTVDRRIEMQEKMLSLKKEYLHEFRAVLPIRKVAKLQKIEREFKRTMLKHMRKEGKGKQKHGKYERRDRRPIPE